MLSNFMVIFVVFSICVIKQKTAIMKKLLGLPLLTIAATLLLSSCVSSKKFKGLESDYQVLNNKFNQGQDDLKRCEDDLLKAKSYAQSVDQQNSQLQERLKEKQNETEFLQNNTQQMLGRLQDLSVMSDKQADAVRKSLDKLAERDIYIKDLQSAMARKDSLNLALVMNLKGSLGNVADDDLNIEVEKGVIYISISDKLLFQSGSYNLTPRAIDVLGKVAVVLNNQPNLEFLVEGHTDNVPIKTAAIKDNWDLSVLRATSVVRALQERFKIDPKRMTAGGRGQYQPLVANDSQANRSVNRRTRIVVLPQLDQFFQLLEPDTQATLPGEGN
jgi:chemotaxis protein MotB